MRGFPGSGKSSLAQRLGQGGAVFSTDDLFMSPEGKYDFNPALLGQNHGLNIKRAREAMLNGVTPVVIDNTNVRADDIRPYAALAKEFGYTMEFKEPETPWKFDAKELAKRNTHRVPQENIEKMLQQWEPNLNPDSFS